MQRSLPDLFVDRVKQTKAFRKMLDGQTRRRIMLLKAEEGMGKSWLLHIFAHEAKIRNLPLVHIDFADRRPYDTLTLVRRCRDAFGSEHFKPLTQTINAVTSPSEIRSVRNADAHTSETYRRYETGLAQLLSRLGPDHASYSDALIFQHRLVENIEHCRLHGDTEIHRSNRSVIVGQLNLLAASALSLTFYELCQNLDEQQREVGSTMIKDNFFVIQTNDSLEHRAIEDRINTDFFDCLSQLSKQSTVIFLFDTYERNSLKSDRWVPRAADRWIIEDLLSRIRDGKLDNTVVVMAGRRMPEFGDEWNEVLGRRLLDPFDSDDLKEYLHNRCGLTIITEAEIIRLHQAIAGHPQLVGLIAHNLEQVHGTTLHDDEW